MNKRWTNQWKQSPRYARAKTIDPSMPSNKFIRLVSSLPKRQTSIYTQLRTRWHVPLNHHLHRIKRSDSPSAAVVRSRTTVRTGLLVRFSVVRSMVLMLARTGPKNGSQFEVLPNGSNLVRPSRTIPNRNFDYTFFDFRLSSGKRDLAIFGFIYK